MRTARVFLRGGLGNQFFEWLHALSLAESGQPVALDTSFLRKVCNNQASGRLELSKVFSDLQLPLHHTPGLWRIQGVFTRMARMAGLLQTDAADSPRRGIRYHYGYYQHPRHFSDRALRTARSLVRPVWRTRDVRLPRYAAIHIRGGDYAASRYNREQIGLLESAYYEQVFRELAADHSELPWLVVSDDYPRARALVAQAVRGTRPVFLDEHLGGTDNPDEALKALLNAHVLCSANSSFSAMAGYLGTPNRVYAPAPWFRGPSLAEFNPALASWRRLDARFAAP